MRGARPKEHLSPLNPIDRAARAELNKPAHLIHAAKTRMACFKRRLQISYVSAAFSSPRALQGASTWHGTSNWLTLGALIYMVL